MIALLEFIALKIVLWIIILPVCWFCYFIRQDYLSIQERREARELIAELHEFKSFRERL